MDKQAVARQFSSAAQQYDAAAHLQRKIADRLLALVKNIQLPVSAKIADLGTGTGYCLPMLQQQFNPARLYALDFSDAMLDVARARQPNIECIHADLETAPFERQSLDLVVSSLAVQWLDKPEPFIANITKALKPGGVLALTTLGPKTLWELKLAWAQVDTYRHVNDFHDAVDWIEAVWESELTLELWREERVEVRYDSPLELLRELKALGANHVDRDHSPRSSHLRQMLRQYDGFKRSDGRYPATWDACYLIARKR
ncbi:MAG: malonyl-ACP O-methyltransferase BioC [Reinekea sp.]|jgi:malonyl-CoA O-methyltransferase